VPIAAARGRRSWAAAVLAGACSIGAVAFGASRCAVVEASPEAEAVDAAVDFLDRYVRSDGRVVRTDQGGDTVSEGQAYAMLLAAAVGDEERFRSVWAWTRANLWRDDGLFAWRWADGSVVDNASAADADLLVAGALAIAGRRFGDPGLLDAARATSAAILAEETFAAGQARVLAAGPWAVGERVVNPSYLVVNVMSHLWWLGAREWAPVAATARSMLDELTARAPHLPPDWATVAADDAGVAPASSPSGEPPRYGYDAVRVVVQLAVDCNVTGQGIAARPWPFLGDQAEDGGLAVAYSLSGDVLDAASHPVAWAAAAASAAAAGDEDASESLLDEADARDDEHPSYYGAAWVALARVWLDTDRLGGCRPGEPRSA
jgi:endoglucanase